MAIVKINKFWVGKRGWAGKDENGKIYFPIKSSLLEEYLDRIGRDIPPTEVEIIKDKGNYAFINLPKEKEKKLIFSFNPVYEEFSFILKSISISTNNNIFNEKIIFRGYKYNLEDVKNTIVKYLPLNPVLDSDPSITLQDKIKEIVSVINSIEKRLKEENKKSKEKVKKALEIEWAKIEKEYGVRFIPEKERTIEERKANVEVIDVVNENIPEEKILNFLVYYVDDVCLGRCLVRNPKWSKKLEEVLIEKMNSFVDGLKTANDNVIPTYVENDVYKEWE